MTRLLYAFAFGWILRITYGMGESDGAREARAEAEAERESIIATAGEMLADAEVEHLKAQAASRAEFGLVATPRDDDQPTVESPALPNDTDPEARP